uniref:RHS repeat domain-containing protein n=1 Tax=Xylanibacter rarus TaxID=1676614 RepID=UPI001EFAA86D|nr:RHS repeat domain-containing protein [Xylanibacter rarus]
MQRLVRVTNADGNVTTSTYDIGDRRTEATPDESQKTGNNHAYEYDANGNLVYVNTGRTKKDGTTDEKAHERKLKWDEENRLLASDDDGFVTNYWYDADGESTVKTSGESEQVYVNSEFADTIKITTGNKKFCFILHNHSILAKPLK